jgi:hypothetical protein
MKLLHLRETSKEKELNLRADDLEWQVQSHTCYLALVTLFHKPTKEKITQASDATIYQAKELCLRELQRRIASKEYKGGSNGIN